VSTLYLAKSRKASFLFYFLLEMKGRGRNSARFGSEVWFGARRGDFRPPGAGLPAGSVLEKMLAGEQKKKPDATLDDIQKPGRREAYPLLRLQESGYPMRLTALELRTYAGKRG